MGETPIKYQCTKSKCKWIGTDEQKAHKIVSSIEHELCCPECLNVEFYGLREGMKFKHCFTGNVGEFIKEYKPTGKPTTMQIKLSNGEIYFAPSIEFKQFHEAVC